MDIPLPILAGPLRGCWWLPSSGGKVLRVLLGTYERAQTEAFERLVEHGQVVFDLGAHVGYYSILAARRVGPTGTVIAFEPDPRNVRSLRRHARLNRAQRLRIVEAAVGDHEGPAGFAAGTGTGTGHVVGAVGSNGSTRAVQLTTIDHHVARAGLVPDLIKIDVEGAEAAVLRGGRRTLQSARPRLLLSTHGMVVRRECLELLDSLRYAATPMDQAGHELLCVPATGAGLA
ncbi:MAG: FkbM family methyltransferase [Longimicrobiales bacterium]